MLQYIGCNNGSLFAVADELDDAARERTRARERGRKNTETGQQRLKLKKEYRDNNTPRERKKAQREWLKKGRAMQAMSSISFDCLSVLYVELKTN